MYTVISFIIFCNLYSIATPEHPNCLRLKNYVRVVALTPDLQSVSFYNAIDFLSYSCTTELVPPLKPIKRF
jgi:hypothetical protein